MNKILNHLKENWIRHGFETLVVIVGVMIAFALNNWNEDRIDEKKNLGKLKIVYQELLDDISTLEAQIGELNQLNQLMFRALDIIEEESSLGMEDRQVLDSAFARYKYLRPLFNNLRSYEEFLLTESDFIDIEIYSELNEYIDQFEEVRARIQRFAESLNQAEYDIELMPSVSRKNSGEFVYSFEEIRNDKNLFEAIRIAKQYQGSVARGYGEVLEMARKLESKIQKELRTLP